MVTKILAEYLGGPLDGRTVEINPDAAPATLDDRRPGEPKGSGGLYVVTDRRTRAPYERPIYSYVPPSAPKT